MTSMTSIIIPLLLFTALLTYIQRSRANNLSYKPFSKWIKIYNRKKDNRYFTAFRNKFIYNFIERAIWAGECMNLYDFDLVEPLQKQTDNQQKTFTFSQKLYDTHFETLSKDLTQHYPTQDLYQLPAEAVGAFMMAIKLLGDKEGLKAIHYYIDTEGFPLGFDSREYTRDFRDYEHFPVEVESKDSLKKLETSEDTIIDTGISISVAYTEKSPKNEKEPLSK